MASVKLVAGLGNPGERYARTPHNVGFMTIDELARRHDCRLRRSLRFGCDMGRAALGGEEVLLIKPRTFMNQSGHCVGAVMRYHRLAAGDLILVLDDADLEPGRLRVRAAGSSGGHRGLQSVIEAAGSQDFARVRVGIGRGRPGEDLVGHVLSAMGPAEMESLERAVSRAADAVERTAVAGAQAAMNEFNARAADAGEQQERRD